MQATCPHCAFHAEIEAFFADGEGKRLAAVVAELPPECGRAVLAYLRLFKPPKTALRMARAVRLGNEVLALIRSGSVARDERTGVRRAATPAMWAEGMETMLSQRQALTLPLEGHGYLRAVVFGLADKADAAQERQRETDARAGKHLAGISEKSQQQLSEDALDRQLRWIAQQVGYGVMDDAEATAARAEAKQRYGGQ